MEKIKKYLVLPVLLENENKLKIFLTKRVKK